MPNVYAANAAANKYAAALRAILAKHDAGNNATGETCDCYPCRVARHVLGGGKIEAIPRE